MTELTSEEWYRVSSIIQRNLTVIRGSGARLWDESGKEYVDLGISYGVCNVGHCNPLVVESVRKQAEALIYVGPTVGNDTRLEFLRKLTSTLPGSLSRVFLCNSGSESVEAAMKFARSATNRTKFVSMKRAFHGRTLGALSLTWRREYRDGFGPLVPGVGFVGLDDIEALKGAVTSETAALFLEVVQGEGGVHVASKEYLKTARDLCGDVGAVLVFDEVQTGFGRCGTLYAFEQFGVVPDILCLSKSIAGGLPMGATVVSEDLNARLKGTHNTTFGGNPLACAAAKASLDYLLMKDLPKRSAEMGSRLMRKLGDMNSPRVREIRGLGLMIAVELKERSGRYLAALAEKGFLAIPAGSNGMRLLPPLVIDEGDMSRAVQALEEVLCDG